jgi:hypothetical protein
VLVLLRQLLHRCGVLHPRALKRRVELPLPLGLLLQDALLVLHLLLKESEQLTRLTLLHKRVTLSLTHRGLEV